jgi:propionyl-CoA carboxylase alpha chain
MIRRLLVANRGEIARRIFDTCRVMGIETVAVYSDADADAPHAREAQHAVRLPGAAPGQTYLRADLIVDAARRSGADAVHPGYGFLSENADFATAVLDAGLVWVGPPPKAIAALGSKLEAKVLLGRAGVPMLPSWTEPDEVSEFPVLVKASAGGGGRGMRIARDPADLAEAVAAARREAAAAFGDDTVFCERYVESGRHVEVQILADAHGGVVWLGERECSIQRRHQKIIEETPSPAVDDELRTALGEAAVAAARAVGYVGAGTVEFLLAPDGRFAFLEMNTRLQVEHPVTECVTGLDLVRLQITIAEGEPLPFETPPPTRGHAIEARLYAEDPGHDWRPSAGVLHRFTVPTHASATSTLRVDSGVVDGSVVGVHYDPLLAKVIAWAPTRHEAARRLAGALAGSRLHGVLTNRDLLVRVLRHPEFLAGGTDTQFLERNADVFSPLLVADEDRALVGLAAALAGVAARRTAEPWGALPAAWRNVASQPRRVVYDAPWGRMDVAYALDRTGRLVDWSGDHPVVVVAARPDEVVFDVAGVRRAIAVHAVGSISYVDCEFGSAPLVEVPPFAGPSEESAAGSLVAPMPGTVGRVAVAPGDTVDAGAVLLTLEAMKLEHVVRAPEAGVVAELHVEPGTQVEAGTPLARITPHEPHPESDA